MSTTNKKIQKGWMILVDCMLIQAIPYCIAANIQPLFISSVIKKILKKFVKKIKSMMRVI